LPFLYAASRRLDSADPGCPRPAPRPDLAHRLSRHPRADLPSCDNATNGTSRSTPASPQADAPSPPSLAKELSSGRIHPCTPGPRSQQLLRAVARILFPLVALTLCAGRSTGNSQVAVIMKTHTPPPARTKSLACRLMICYFQQRLSY
jgi:hypothetical protein